MGRYVRLAWSDRVLLIESVAILWVIRLGLWLLPFQALRRLLTRLTRSTPKPRDEDPDFIRRVARAMRVTGRLVPGTTCLTQALAAQILLGQRGYHPLLRIGVAKDGGGRLEAHAWLESQGRVVIGESANPSRFTPLPPLDTGSL